MTQTTVNIWPSSYWTAKCCLPVLPVICGSR